MAHIQLPLMDTLKLKRKESTDCSNKQSPSYSPQLGDEKLQSDARQGTSLDNAEDVLSFDDFNVSLSNCPLLTTNRR